MVFVNMRSKVAHYPECHMVSRIADMNLGCYENAYYAGKDSYRVCKCCDPMVKRLSNQKDDMVDYCQKKGIEYKIENGELLIRTQYSSWKAYTGANDQYILYHRNTRGNTNCYHLQTKRYTDIMAVLKYIDHHDYFRLSNPLPEDRIVIKKSAPRKGSKKYKAAMQRAEKAKKRDDVRRVLSLIDSLAM